MESLSDPSSGLRFAAACHTAAYFPLIFSLQFSVQSHHSFTVYDIQSHHVTLSVRRSEPLLQFCEFRATIISQFQRSEPPLLSFGVQSHHYHFSVSTFKAIIITFQFRRSKPSLVFSLTFKFAFLNLTFKVAFLSLTFRLAFSVFGVQSYHHFLVSAFRTIIVFSV